MRFLRCFGWRSDATITNDGGPTTEPWMIDAQMAATIEICLPAWWNGHAIQSSEPTSYICNLVVPVGSSSLLVAYVSHSRRPWKNPVLPGRHIHSPGINL